MCCLFGVLDYGNSLSYKNKNLMLSVLSTECEERGIDATGIAYNTQGRLSIYKRPLPAHKLSYRVPNNARFIMGHTRLTTQGSEKRNYNNHPFLGFNNHSGAFALCHNGVLRNDILLRKSENMPPTQIQTDSYVAVQLIEKQQALDFDSLKHMAEKIEGSFTFTVLDSNNHLYIIRGDNPFCLYHYPAHGFYLYASTEGILKRAITHLNIQRLKTERISLSCGDILMIDSSGKIQRKRFSFPDRFYYTGRTSLCRRSRVMDYNTKDEGYIDDLKFFASLCGYAPECVEELLAAGFDYDEIEDFLYTSQHRSDELEGVCVP